MFFKRWIEYYEIPLCDLKKIIARFANELCVLCVKILAISPITGKFSSKSFPGDIFDFNGSFFLADYHRLPQMHARLARMKSLRGFFSR
jgi:hypothetical protein